METNRLYCGDASEIMKTFPNESIDLVVTSPPYDNLRKYNNNGQWNHDKFMEIAKELTRTLKQGGVIVWNVNDKVENGSKTGTSFRQALYFMDLGLNLNDTMIWKKTNPCPQVRQPRYNQVFEYMFIFSKGKPKTFNPMMVECKCSGRNYDSTCRNIGGENGRTEKHFIINKEKVADNVWEFAVAQNKTEHPAVFPIELPLRHIRTWSNENDIVLDPFVGSGTTAIAAKRLNRQYIGIDISQQYVELSEQRIKDS